MSGERFVRIPSKLPLPIPPSPDLPPELRAQAYNEYEAAMKRYQLEKMYGANFEENPDYIAEKPFLDAQWEAVKDVIL